MSAPTDGAPADPAAGAVIGALHWRIIGDAEAGQHAITALPSLLDIESGSADPVITSGRRTFGLLQAAECVRDHPALTDRDRMQLFDTLAAAADRFSTRVNSGDPLETAWRSLLLLSVGVVLERHDDIESASENFRAIIHQVVPHGYIPSIVEQRDGGSLTRTVQIVQALVLMAEIASHVGVDLWGYEQRGVSLMTAALYPLYYYYYPEKWLWDEGLEIEPVQAMFKQHASFLEIINRHTAARPIHAVTLILSELRPVMDWFGGGPVTLTHMPPPPKRRGLFRR